MQIHAGFAALHKTSLAFNPKRLFNLVDQRMRHPGKHDPSTGLASFPVSKIRSLKFTRSMNI